MSFYLGWGRAFADQPLAPAVLPHVLSTGGAPSYLLGLLAKIKCSICSYQLNF